MNRVWTAIQFDNVRGRKKPLKCATLFVHVQFYFLFWTDGVFFCLKMCVCVYVFNKFFRSSYSARFYFQIFFYFNYNNTFPHSQTSKQSIELSLCLQNFFLMLCIVNFLLTHSNLVSLWKGFLRSHHMYTHHKCNQHYFFFQNFLFFLQ